MFLGLRTAIYHVSDIEAGKNWYARSLVLRRTSMNLFMLGSVSAVMNLGCNRVRKRQLPRLMAL